MHFVPPFGVGGTLPGLVTLIYNGSVEEVFPERHHEVVSRVFDKADGFHRGEGVGGGLDRRGGCPSGIRDYRGFSREIVG